MRTWKTTDKHCPTCHGLGEFMSAFWLKFDFFVLTSACHCVGYQRADGASLSALTKS